MQLRGQLPLHQAAGPPDRLEAMDLWRHSKVRPALCSDLILNPPSMAWSSGTLLGKCAVLLALVHHLLLSSLFHGTISCTRMHLP